MQPDEFTHFFQEACFIPELESTTKAGALEEMVQRLVDTGWVKSKNLVMETLNKRETLGSTGIGKGVAIPHCRTLAVSDIHVVVGISSEGVEYGSIDKKKVHLLFLIVAPPQEESNLYLPLLGRIVEMLRETKKRRELMKATEYSAFLAIIQGG